MPTGPVVIGFDGSPSSVHALKTAGALLAGHQAVVVVVWDAGLPFEILEIPTIPPAPLDVRTAIKIDMALYERAQKLAEQGAAIARKVGLKAKALAVADDVTVADTLIRLADEDQAQAVVVGAHGHSGVREVVLGSTSRDVIEHAPCPVVVVRGSEAPLEEARPPTQTRPRAKKAAATNHRARH
jgi:nucleotide-binding universal stress UspA family protein